MAALVGCKNKNQMHVDDNSQNALPQQRTAPGTNLPCVGRPTGPTTLSLASTEVSTWRPRSIPTTCPSLRMVPSAQFCRLTSSTR
ncbi:hypothetical protein BC567DRAFT_215769 [Phyllosticta citribraziliensis]